MTRGVEVHTIIKVLPTPRADRHNVPTIRAMNDSWILVVVQQRRAIVTTKHRLGGLIVRQIRVKRIAYDAANRLGLID